MEAARAASPEKAVPRLAMLRGKLLKEREKRIRPGSRRQGARRLERIDDRRLGECRSSARRNRPGSPWRRALLRFIAAYDDPRRPAGPFLARRGGLAVPRPRLRLHLHGEGRARPLRSDRGNAPTSIRPSPGSTRSTDITPIRTMAAISSPPTMPKASWCARPQPMTTRRRTRTPFSARQSGAARGSRRRRMRGAIKADRLIEGVLGMAGETLIGHAALLDALDLRLRGGRDCRHRFPRANAP